MSTKQTTRPQDINKVAWYKRAILPWVLIAFAVTVSLSFIAGWYMHAQDTSRVTQEAATLVSTLKADAK